MWNGSAIEADDNRLLCSKCGRSVIDECECLTDLNENNDIEGDDVKDEI